MIRTVVDTNVLVSSLISPFGNEAQILDAVRRGRIRPCLSRGILEEYADVLARPKFGFPKEAIEGVLMMLRARGMVFEPNPSPGASPDPGDDEFIACALAGDAEFIVTGNKRDFPSKSCGKAKVVSARELLDFLGTRRSP